MDVSTDNDDTANWLSDSLLVQQVQENDGIRLEEPWWAHLERQSERGILLKVEKGVAEFGGWNEITEILLYASVKGDNASLPTPPTSSSPTPPGESVSEDHTREKEIKVYALPLSSNIINHAKHGAQNITPHPEGIPKQARFLPLHPREHDEIRTISQKRQSLSSLFNDATQKRRKLKGRGGESVAQAMASIDRPASQHSMLPAILNECQETSTLPVKAKVARTGLTRAATVSGSEFPRPSSRSGSLANGKRSSLHRVESAVSPRDSPTFSDADDSVAQQNKAALTKMVMAGMRLYGFQQKKKPGTASTIDPRAVAGASAPSNDVEEEYKLVYHQTFKAVSFTFRKQMQTQVIAQDLMRDVVDRCLNLFCTDPSMSADSDPGNVIFGSQGSESFGAFDKPSGKNSSPVLPKTWSTSTVKKR